MKITFLGTSHGFNEPGRFCSSAVVTVDGKHYVIDAGAPIMGLLPTRGFSYSAVAGIFITHNHSDHFLGLVEFIRQIEGFGEFEGIHVNVHVPEEFPSAAINVFNFGDPAGKPVPLPGGAHTRKDPGRRIDFITYPDPESVIFDDGKVKITAIPNMHIAHSHSFLIEAEGKRVVFSGDMKRDFPDYPAVLTEPGAAGGRVNLFVVEGAHTRLCKPEIIEIFRRTRTQRLIVSHVNYAFNTEEMIGSMRDAVADLYPVDEAFDGMVVKI